MNFLIGIAIFMLLAGFVLFELVGITNQFMYLPEERKQRKLFEQFFSTLYVWDMNGNLELAAFQNVGGKLMFRVTFYDKFLVISSSGGYRVQPELYYWSQINSFAEKRFLWHRFVEFTYQSADTSRLVRLYFRSYAKAVNILSSKIHSKLK